MGIGLGVFEYNKGTQLMWRFNYAVSVGNEHSWGSAIETILHSYTTNNT